MTEKKKRNLWAKQITRSISFVMRHRIANKISKIYDYFEFSSTPLRVLEEVGITVGRPNRDIAVIGGKAFHVFSWQDYGDDFPCLAIDLTKGGECMYGVADPWGSPYHGTCSQCENYVQDHWSDDFPMEVFRDYTWDVSTECI